MVKESIPNIVLTSNDFSIEDDKKIEFLLKILSISHEMRDYLFLNNLNDLLVNKFDNTFLEYSKYF